MKFGQISDRQNLKQAQLIVVYNQFSNINRTSTVISLRTFEMIVQPTDLEQIEEHNHSSQASVEPTSSHRRPRPSHSQFDKQSRSFVVQDVQNSLDDDNQADRIFEFQYQKANQTLDQLPLPDSDPEENRKIDQTYYYFQPQHQQRCKRDIDSQAVFCDSLADETGETPTKSIGHFGSLNQSQTQMAHGISCFNQSSDVEEVIESDLVHQMTRHPSHAELVENNIKKQMQQTEQRRLDFSDMEIETIITNDLENGQHLPINKPEIMNRELDKSSLQQFAKKQCGQNNFYNTRKQDASSKLQYSFANTKQNQIMGKNAQLFSSFGSSIKGPKNNLNQLQQLDESELRLTSIQNEIALRDFGQEDLGGFMNHSKNSDLGLNFGNTVDDSKINPYQTMQVNQLTNALQYRTQDPKEVLGATTFRQSDDYHKQESHHNYFDIKGTDAQQNISSGDFMAISNKKQQNQRSFQPSIEHKYALNDIGLRMETDESHRKKQSKSKNNRQHFKEISNTIDVKTDYDKIMKQQQRQHIQASNCDMEDQQIHHLRQQALQNASSNKKAVSKNADRKQLTRKVLNQKKQNLAEKTILDRIQSLNQEKELLMKQLQIQKMIDQGIVDVIPISTGRSTIIDTIQSHRFAALQKSKSKTSQQMKENRDGVHSNKSTHRGPFYQQINKHEFNSTSYNKVDQNEAVFREISNNKINANDQLDLYNVMVNPPSKSVGKKTKLRSPIENFTQKPPTGGVPIQNDQFRKKTQTRSQKEQNADLFSLINKQKNLENDFSSIQNRFLKYQQDQKQRMRSKNKSSVTQSQKWKSNQKTNTKRVTSRSKQIPRDDKSNIYDKSRVQKKSSSPLIPSQFKGIQYYQNMWNQDHLQSLCHNENSSFYRCNGQNDRKQSQFEKLETDVFSNDLLSETNLLPVNQEQFQCEDRTDAPNNMQEKIQHFDVDVLNFITDNSFHSSMCKDKNKRQKARTVKTSKTREQQKSTNNRSNNNRSKIDSEKDQAAVQVSMIDSQIFSNEKIVSIDQIDKRDVLSPSVSQIQPVRLSKQNLNQRKNSFVRYSCDKKQQKHCAPSHDKKMSVQHVDVSNKQHIFSPVLNNYLSSKSRQSTSNLKNKASKRQGKTQKPAGFNFENYKCRRNQSKNQTSSHQVDPKKSLEFKSNRVAKNQQGKDMLFESFNCDVQANTFARNQRNIVAKSSNFDSLMNSQRTFKTIENHHFGSGTQQKLDIFLTNVIRESSQRRQRRASAHFSNEKLSNKYNTRVNSPNQTIRSKIYSPMSNNSRQKSISNKNTSCKMSNCENPRATSSLNMPSNVIVSSCMNQIFDQNQASLKQREKTSSILGSRHKNDMRRILNMTPFQSYNQKQASLKTDAPNTLKALSKSCANSKSPVSKQRVLTDNFKTMPSKNKKPIVDRNASSKRTSRKSSRGNPQKSDKVTLKMASSNKSLSMSIKMAQSKSLERTSRHDSNVLKSFRSRNQSINNRNQRAMIAMTDLTCEQVNEQNKFGVQIETGQNEDKVFQTYNHDLEDQRSNLHDNYIDYNCQTAQPTIRRESDQLIKSRSQKNKSPVSAVPFSLNSIPQQSYIDPPMPAGGNNSSAIKSSKSQSHLRFKQPFVAMKSTKKLTIPKETRLKTEERSGRKKNCKRMRDPEIDLEPPQNIRFD